MDELVVDTSVLSALFLKEENSEQVRMVIESGVTLYAPSFWRFEVSNAVRKRKEIPATISQEIIEIIWSFPVYTNESKEMTKESLNIALKHDITFYDSFYIAMAKILDIPLWSFDKIQKKVAMRVGISLWEKSTILS